MKIFSMDLELKGLLKMETMRKFFYGLETWDWAITLAGWKLL